MSPKSAQTKIASWIYNMITNMTALFDLPNPRIFTLFMISSTATFCLGIAMMLEWGLYSQYHPGYHWITYYAPCLITFPIFIWIFCIIIATIFSGNKERNLRIVPSFEPPNPNQPLFPDIHHQRWRNEEKGQLEQVDALRNQLALVPVQVVRDTPTSESAKEDAANAKAGIDNNNKSTLKRNLSLSLFGNNKYIDHCNIKRTMSFG